MHLFYDYTYRIQERRSKINGGSGKINHSNRKIQRIGIRIRDGFNGFFRNRQKKRLRRQANPLPIVTDANLTS